MYHADKTNVTRPADHNRASLVLGGCLQNSIMVLGAGGGGGHAVRNRSLSSALPGLLRHCGHLFPVLCLTLSPCGHSQQCVLSREACIDPEQTASCDIVCDTGDDAITLTADFHNVSQVVSKLGGGDGGGGALLHCRKQ